MPMASPPADISTYGAMIDRARALIPRLRGRSDAAATLDALIKAALADEDGQALDKAIAELGAAEPASASG